MFVKKLSLDAMHLLYTIEVVTWGQCDRCNHWTHLKNCFKDRKLRRNESFYCPFGGN